MRDYGLYLEDILQAVKRIEKYKKGITFGKFKKDTLRVDAVVRNLEIIGEAAKKIPQNIRKDAPDIEWKKLSGLRDILIHEYFSVDMEILWDIIENKLPALKKGIARLLK